MDTAKSAIKDYIKSCVAPLNQQVLDIDEQVEKLTDLQEVQTCFNDTVIEGIQKLKNNNKGIAERLSNATNRLSSAENQIKLLEKEDNDRSTEICKLTEMCNELEEKVKVLSAAQVELIKTVQRLEEDRDTLYTIVDLQATELKAFSDMYKTFMELLKWKEKNNVHSLK